jgi:multiple sugar transport system substrate-binding protein
MYKSYLAVGYPGGGGMRRAIPGIAVLAAGLLYLTGCTSGGAPAGGPAGKFGVAALPGPDGMGSSPLGGANLAISAYSQHQQTALDFIKYMTNLDNERQMLEQGSFPPVWTKLYTDKSLIRRYPYLPVLEQAINSARPRPAITNYDQASLAISSAVYEALTQQKQPQQALTEWPDN